MNTENNALITNLLALSVKDGNKFDYKSVGMYAPTPEYIMDTDVDGFAIYSKEEVDAIFFNLTPQYTYIDLYIGIEDSEGEFTCQCFSDGNQLVTAVQSEMFKLPLSFIGSHPCNSKRFPQSGYLTIAFLKDKLSHRPAILAKALKSLFEAIGNVCYPKSKAPGKQAEKIYLKDLAKHSKKATFPLKGAPVQQGCTFFMNGDEYVFTAYGIARMIGNFYGDLVLDTAISFEDNAGCHIIRMTTHCNNEQRAQNSIFTIEDYQADKLPSLHDVFEIPDALMNVYGHSQDFDLFYTLGIAVRSVVHSFETKMNYVDSWNSTARLVQSAFVASEIEGAIFEERHP